VGSGRVTRVTRQRAVVRAEKVDVDGHRSAWWCGTGGAPLAGRPRHYTGSNKAEKKMFLGEIRKCRRILRRAPAYVRGHWLPPIRECVPTGRCSRLCTRSRRRKSFACVLTDR
jgi:hypothetical protein